MKLGTTSLLALAALFLAGCANQTSVWRNEHGAGNVMAMDAQQRVVLSASVSVPTALGTRTTVVTKANGSIERTVAPDVHMVPKVYYCPEPSPDAIASFASALGIGLGKSTGAGSVDGKLSSALATTVAAVGLRTPTTQVIRDLITAACIADLNGSFKSPEFKDAFARNQQFVLAAHAIAVIGGESVAAQPAVGGSAGTGGMDPTVMFNNLKSAQASRKAADVAVSDAESQRTAAEAARTLAKTELDAAPNDASKKTGLEKADAALKKAQASETEAKTTLKDAQVLEAAAGRAASAAAALTSAVASGSVTPGTAHFTSKEGLIPSCVQ